MLGVKDGDLVYRLLQGIAREAFARYEYHGIYQYQVFQQTDDKVDLQVIRKRPGLPDILQVPMHPGLAGALSYLTAGSTVLVQFIDGEPTRPVIVSFAPKSDGDVRYPSVTQINANDLIDIGLNNLQNPVKWDDFATFCNQTITAINTLKTNLTAGLLLCQPLSSGPGVAYTPTATAPNFPSGAQATKVRVE